MATGTQAAAFGAVRQRPHSLFAGMRVDALLTISTSASHTRAELFYPLLAPQVKHVDCGRCYSGARITVIRWSKYHAGDARVVFRIVKGPHSLQVEHTASLCSHLTEQPASMLLPEDPERHTRRRHT